VSETTTTVEEVKQTAQMASDKARHVSDTAQKTVQISLGGRRSVEESIEAMHRIQEQMESIAQSIVRLSEQGQAIGEIIATVNDLAEQSNLLAVNAAVEAAKAGEQGKGFVVLAQEVKSLAGQSKQATAQVRSILGDIQKATGAAVMAAEQGSKAVETGMTLSAQVRETIVALADSIEEAGTRRHADRRLGTTADGGHGPGSARDAEHQAGERAKRRGHPAKRERGAEPAGPGTQLEAAGRAIPLVAVAPNTCDGREGKRISKAAAGDLRGRGG
jgi:hypothetical protein